MHIHVLNMKDKVRMTYIYIQISSDWIHESNMDIKVINTIMWCSLLSYIYTRRLFSGCRFIMHLSKHFAKNQQIHHISMYQILYFPKRYSIFISCPSITSWFVFFPVKIYHLNWSPYHAGCCAHVQTWIQVSTIPKFNTIIE